MGRSTASSCTTQARRTTEAIIAVFRFLALGMLFLTATGQSAEIAFPPPPRLATTREELAATKASPEFKAQRDAAVAAAEPLVARPVELPAGPGSWIFYYACPQDGTTLRHISLEEHECPKCKKRFTDARTVAAYRCQMHYDLENAALQLAWAFAYTDHEPYAAGVRRVLLHLADQYGTYPGRQDRWGRSGWFAPLGGRRYVQSLDEAVGVIRLAKAYDLTRTAAVWSDEERKHVEDDFFRATSKTLLAFNQDINNHQTWYNAGLMAIASVLADRDLAEKVLSMRGGFRDQLQRSLGDDGLWYEGTMAYQNYALQAMVEIVDAGRRIGLALDAEPRLKALLDSSLKVAYPNGQYPAINDSDPLGFQGFTWSYDWAWRTYSEPRYAQAAAWGNPAKLAKLLGPDAKPEWPLESGSLKLADAGLAILRAGEGANQTCVFFDYGKHGGGHGHFDKLNITLFAAGREWLFDTGRIGYTHREYKTWVKHSVAHNTVVVDETDQFPTTGKLRWLQTGADWSACAGECGSAYPGVLLRRHLLLTPRMLVDIYDVHADREASIDWLAHAVTQVVEPVRAATARPVEKIGSGAGYEHLTEGRTWTGDLTCWDFPAERSRLRLWLDVVPQEAILTATGVGSTVDQRAPALIRRQRGRRARFVTVYDLTGDGSEVTGLGAVAGEFAGLSIDTAGGRWQIQFSDAGVAVEKPKGIQR